MSKWDMKHSLLVKTLVIDSDLKDHFFSLFQNFQADLVILQNKTICSFTLTKNEKVFHSKTSVIKDFFH